MPLTKKLVIWTVIYFQKERITRFIKTIEIINEAEGYDRGFYTGVMGIFSNGELNSAVMIRFVEEDKQGIVFKAGGGITAKSDCRKEFEEVLQKIYLPIAVDKVAGT